MLAGSHAARAPQAYRGQFISQALLEFDRDRKSMSVLASRAGSKDGNMLLVKGAAECVLERCTRVMLPDGSVVALTADGRAAVMGAVEQMASDALRCLALAYRPAADLPAPLKAFASGQHNATLADPAQYSALESGMVFLGLAGLMDPPRPEVRPAIEECKKAGIRVMVITGDNKKTAEAICQAIGVFPADGKGLASALQAYSYTGRDFVSLPRERQLEILASAPSMCFSRAEPKHKQDIVSFPHPRLWRCRMPLRGWLRRAASGLCLIMRAGQMLHLPMTPAHLPSHA